MRKRKSTKLTFMKIVVWVLQALLAIAFLGAGMMKLITPYADLAADPNMGWVEGFSATQIKIIGALEVLGGIGLVLPMIVKRFQYLVPSAAIGLALTMVGAAIVHISRGEPVVPNIVLFVLAAAVAWFRKDLFKSK